MRLLLFSNSTNSGEGYLQYPLPHIYDFLGADCKAVLFVPFAGVTIDFDSYTGLVNEKLGTIGIHASSVHQTKNPVKAVHEARAIVVGGGNTFRLLTLLQETGLFPAIRERVLAGIPYVGWSAGANLACPTICTTNDMPVIQPENFRAFNLVPFQINPHYLDSNPTGHAGETREARINEFIELNTGIYVTGLREGTFFRIEQGNIQYYGNKTLRIFRKGIQPYELHPHDDMQFLLKKTAAIK